MNDLLKDVVREIISRADEAKEAYKGNDLEYGRLLGFAEALSIIKQEYTEDQQISELLSFDIDARFL